MTAQECIKERRSIRRFKPDKIAHELLSGIIETASYAPSWKNTQITRYIAVEGALKDQIAQEGTAPFPNNGKIIENAPMLIAVTVIKNRCGYERDGSFTTPRKDTWQMFKCLICMVAPFVMQVSGCRNLQGGTAQKNRREKIPSILGVMIEMTIVRIPVFFWALQASHPDSRWGSAQQYEDKTQF